MGKTNARILIVDDSKLERKIINSFLAPLNYEVVEDDGSQDTLALIRYTKPDLIILDLILSNQDGVEI
ncbi:MAG: response regulator, partial [Clostridia bacterium]|nr:response regulator [Clostridia bacterium]